MKYLLLLSFLGVWCTDAMAQDIEVQPSTERKKYLHPYVSIMGGVALYNPEVKKYEGDFSYTTSSFSKGLELGNIFPLRSGFAIKAGIRVLSVNSSTKGQQPNGTSYNATNYMTWQSNYTIYSIPVALIKEWEICGNRVLEASVGLSYGAMIQGFGNATKGKGVGDYDGGPKLTAITGNHFSNSIKDAQQLNADIGIAFQPFKKCTRFSVGIKAYLQLNELNLKTQYEGHYALEYPTSLETYTYNADYTLKRMSTVVAVLSYKF